MHTSGLLVLWNKAKGKQGFILLLAQWVLRIFVLTHSSDFHQILQRIISFYFKLIWIFQHLFKTLQALLNSKTQWASFFCVQYLWVKVSRQLTGSPVGGHWRKRHDCHLSWSGGPHLPVWGQLALHVILLFAKYNILHEITLNRLQ